MCVCVCVCVCTGVGGGRGSIVNTGYLLKENLQFEVEYRSCIDYQGAVSKITHQFMRT